MENEIMYIKLDDIIPNRFQPREVFEEEALQKLADSIRQHGVIEPIIVRPISNKYEIIAGERRYKASVLAGLTTIPAIIKPMDDKESSIVAYIENEHRSDVSAIEEARTIDRILKSNNITQEELAKQIGINQSTLANKLRLLSLPSEIQNALMHNEISERHARSLLSVKDEAKQIELLNKIKTNKMTVRELDSEIKSMNNNLDNMNNNFNFNNGFNDNGFINQPSPSPMTGINNGFNQYLNNPVTDSGIQAPNNSLFSTPTSFNATPENNLNSDVNQYLNNPVNELPKTPEPVVNDNKNDFMSFLNDYNTPTTPVEQAPIEDDEQSNDDSDGGILDFFNAYEAKKATEATASSAPIEEPASNTDPSFMSFLNDFDSKNPLPVEDDGTETGGSNLNMGEAFNNNETNVETPTIDSGLNNNVTLNSVIPPITTPIDNNSYIENNENFVDVSKEVVINSVDEIIDKLKVVVDDIKLKSKFKVDTDEINYDDIYQITIRIDKRDF